MSFFPAMGSTPAIPPGVIQIDPRGDVVIEVGENDLRAHLLVSSKVLSVVSPVFTAMFNRGFQEGENLFAKSFQPVHFSDDPEAMTILCNILHHKNREIPRLLTLQTLSSIAVLCDKFDCTEVVTPWSTLWLQTWVDSANEESVEKLLFITYALDIPDMFTKVSHSLLANCAGQLGFNSIPEAHDLLPESLLGMAQTDRSDH
jgi:hypothetical protein